MEQNRSNLEQRIIEMAMKDDGFKEKLKSDPRSAIEEALGIKFPEDMNFHVNEESETDIHITLPSQAGELSEEEMSGISGGWDGGPACEGDSTL